MKALLVAMVAVLAVTAVAGAQAPALRMRADVSERGRIALVFDGPAGAQVRVREGEARLARVTLDDRGRARLARAATWRCDQRRRGFAAEGSAPDGTVLGDNAQVITPGCARRYRFEVRGRRARTDRPVRVRVRDSFRLGERPPRVCAQGPDAARVCAPVRGKRAIALRLPHAASWRLTAEHAAPKRVRVRPEPGPRTILATGDSMIQYVDHALSGRLPSQRVLSDARISTGLSKPFFFDWPRHAVRQVRRSGPDVTVMFIGANDGFAFGEVQCCGGAWRRAYARRASAMMRTYARGGAARVYWCLLPAPRDAAFRRVFGAVNLALRRAARDHRRTVRIVDLSRVFTPGFAYRESIDGTTVRQDDGVHLTMAGADIAAREIIASMRRDGAL